MNRVIPIIYLAGTPLFPRLCVCAVERDSPPNLFWNSVSQSWVVSHEQATLFAHPTEAAFEVRIIQQSQYAGLPIRTFTVPIEIDLYGDLELKKDTFLDWLRKSIRFTVDYGGCGNGPTDTSLALPVVNWELFRELENENPPI
jgi:hypothetical protein